MGFSSATHEKVDHAILEGRARSVAHLFRERARQSTDEVAYQFFVGDTLAEVTWGEVWATVRSWAAGLMVLGVNPGDRVVIISGTRYDWVLADLSIMCSAGVTTTVYPNTMSADVAYLVADSGCTVVFAEDATQVAKLLEHQGQTPTVSTVVCFDPAAADGDWIISADDLVRRGNDLLDADPDAVERRIDALGSTDLATIIYTSGTTGKPKGAELTHDAFVYVGAAADSVGLMRRDDLQFLWLPLSHVFGKVLLTIPMQIGFPTAIDGRIDRVADNLQVIRPTWMGAAPRIFEKVKAKVETGLADEAGSKAALVHWAMGVGRQVATERELAREVPLALRVKYALADRLVLGKVRDRFGGRIRFFVSGSAALDADVARWFAALGLLICEGYGLTETAAFTSLNRPHSGSYQFGSIGWPAPGTSVRIADDGEILVRGPGVMRGYHAQPQATAEVFTEDGYFRTGDIGDVDDHGFVRVTDRKKDVFKTSGGKYIAPSPIEAHFKGLCPYVSQFIVLGDGKNYATALVTLDPEAIRPWAEKHGMGGLPYADIVASTEAHKMVQEYVDELNEGLNRWETIKRFAILPRDLSLDHDELTPSMKVKRKRVVEHFRDEIDALYNGTSAADRWR